MSRASSARWTYELWLRAGGDPWRTIAMHAAGHGRTFQVFRVPMKMAVDRSR